MPTSRLIADIGATHARFAVLTNDEIGQSQVFMVADYDTIMAAIAAYVGQFAADERPTEAALAVAGPVIEDRVVMMNSPWSFSIAGLKQQFGWTRLFVVNDFAANALAVPVLTPDDLFPVGDGAPETGAPVAVLGPGTGLGVAGLIPVASDGVPGKTRWTAIPGEGGNVTLAALDSREAAIIDILRRQYAHVSAEIVLSGPGLVNLYESLCELAGKPATPVTPEDVTHLYPGCDPQRREAVAIFCAMLGTFAGDVALTFGARGGVYIMGGIVPKIAEIFRHSAFRERFEFKGRYRHYLSSVPTYVVMHPSPAFLGLKALFASAGP
ncbi:MAG TPA: glucokinase [Micropepsaceae bacterium]|nr:glucokinase [Micropepsaceae bacterium]